MGIKGLTQLLKEKAPNSIESAGLYSFQDKKIAIDCSIFIYKSLMNIRYNGDYLRNKQGKPVSHIIGLFNKTIQYLSLGITPIYIFDGKPPIEKKECIQERNKKANESKEKLSSATNQLERNQLEKSSIRIKKEHIDDLKLLFDFMGVSYFHPDGEAEAFASELCRIGYVDAVVSEDMDTLAYGCPVLIRSCIDRTIKKKEVCSIFSYPKLLEDMKLTPEQFLDVCVLCGCDYCTTIPKIGPVRAYQYIQQYKTIEDIISSNKFTIPQSFLDRYQKARGLFSIFKNTIDLQNLPSHFHSSQLNNLKLYDFLVVNCNMNEKKYYTSINKIK